MKYLVSVSVLLIIVSLGWSTLSDHSSHPSVGTFVSAITATNDVSALQLTGNSIPAVGLKELYTIQICNSGLVQQTAYKVNLINSDNIVLASVDGPLIVSGQTLSVSIPWIPAAEGLVTLYGQVVLAKDEQSLNDHTPAMSTLVVSNFRDVVTLGSGSSVNTASGDPVPYGTRYKNFHQQYLYTAAEIYAAGGGPGIISALAFNVQTVNNCSPMQNYTIKLKHTQQTSLTTSFETGSFTQVWYQHNFVPVEGWNNHFLTTPFIWNGVDNIIIDIITTLIPGSYTENPSVYYSTTTGTYSSLRYQSSSYDASVSLTGSLSTNRANLQLTLNMLGLGSLDGLVSSGAIPLSDVSIVINNTINQQITNTSGLFHFPFVQPGNYTVTASKPGYETQTVPVTIEADQSTTLDFSMIMSQGVNISGIVVGSDDTTSGLANASINLSGLMSFSGTTNALGQFTIMGVASGNYYSYSIARPGYLNASGNFYVGTTDYHLGTIELIEVILPPVQVQAALNSLDTAVTITWLPPGSHGIAVVEDFDAGDGNWIASSSWASPVGDWEWTGDYDVADWSPIYLDTNIAPPPQAHSGTGMWGTKISTNYYNANGYNYLTKSLDFTGLSNMEMRFWSWENLQGSVDYAQIRINGEIVWGPSWDNIETQWRERVINLSSYDGMANVTITFEMFASSLVNYAGWYIDDLFFGSAEAVVYTAHDMGTPVSRWKTHDSIPAYSLKSDSLKSPKSSLTTSNQYSSIDSRIPVGYKVWRLIEGNEQNEPSWTLLTNVAISDTFFVTQDWQVIPDGFYKWAIKAFYSDNSVSTASVSNVIHKLQNDLSGLSISGDMSPCIGSPVVYDITIKNTGYINQTEGSYTVKLMCGTTELVSVPGPVLAINEETIVPIAWTPVETGTMVVYGKTVHQFDTVPINDLTPELRLFVMEPGSQTFTIGEDTTVNIETGSPTPYGTHYRNFHQQYLFTAADILAVGGGSGFLRAIAFNVQTVNNCSPMQNYKIKLKHTQQTAFSTTFEVGEYTQVWYQNGFVPEEGWNTHFFSSPYLWNGVDNIIVDISTTLISGDFTENPSVYYTETTGIETSLRYQSEGTDASAHLTGTTSIKRSNIRLTIQLNGCLTGTVLGVGNQPLADVLVQFDTGGYSTITNAQGEYTINGIIPNDYAVSFSKRGYIDTTQNITFEASEIQTLNLTLQNMPVVSLSGTINASDTGIEISGAWVFVSGYENYVASTDIQGCFIVDEVYANQEYNITFCAAGYQNRVCDILIGASDYDFGVLVLNELAHAPRQVQAVINDTNTATTVSWQPPDPTALDLSQGFEETPFPSNDWTQVITNTGEANTSGVFPTWCNFGSITISGVPTGPHSGNYQAGLWWSYDYQDEWLITPLFNCPPSAYLRFWSHVFYGSENGDHYYIKISTNGGTSWSILWDASAQTGGWNSYASPITLDLSMYEGLQVKLAWHAEDPESNDGLWYVWFIDDVYIGNEVTAVAFEPAEYETRSASGNGFRLGTLPTTNPSRAVELGMKPVDKTRNHTQTRTNNPSRATEINSRSLVGYKIWRFAAGNENNEPAWTLLTTETHTEEEYTDTGWVSLANGTYRYAVKAVYTSDVLSVPSFSNPLIKEVVTGMIAGVVRRTTNQAIPGATVTAGTYSATTNTAGAYSIVLPIGVYTVTATHPNFQSQSQEEISVLASQTTTVNFILVGVDNEDDTLPVVATALNGNYPNPFNPETTISFAVKEAAAVKLDIYNLKGQLIRSLVHEDKAPGHYRVVWNGKDNQGFSVGSGVYFYRMTAGSYSSTKKMLLME